MFKYLEGQEETIKVRCSVSPTSLQDIEYATAKWAKKGFNVEKSLADTPKLLVEPGGGGLNSPIPIVIRIFMCVFFIAFLPTATPLFFLHPLPNRPSTFGLYDPRIWTH